MKKSFKMGTGKVIYKTERYETLDGKVIVTETPIFRGKPEDTAKALMKNHGNTGALAIIDKLSSTERFWTQARKYVTNQLQKIAEAKLKAG